MNSRESIPPHRFTVSEDELGLAEIQAILAVIDDAETKKHAKTAATKNELKKSKEYIDATKCVRDCQIKANEIVQRFKDKTKLMTKNKFIEMVKQICDEWGTLIEIKRGNYYSETKNPMPPTDAFSSLKKEVQSIADNTVTLADTMWPATAPKEGHTVESKGEGERRSEQKDDKLEAATHDTDKQPEAAARILHYRADILEIEMQGSQRPQSNAKLNEWVEFGTDVFARILTHPEWKLEEAGYKEVVEALFKYTDNQQEKMITHEQFAAMAYAGLRQAYRHAEDNQVISAGGHGAGDGSAEDNYLIHTIHHSAADFKLRSKARPARTELVVGGLLEDYRQNMKEKIQKEKEEEQEELMKDFRVPIWRVLLQHGRTTKRSANAKDHASNISQAIVTTEILQQPYPVQLEHVTRMFKVFMDKLGNDYENIPDNLAHTMKIQAVISYFQLDDFLDDQKKNVRSHEICAIIEQDLEWHDETTTDDAESNITGFWNSCHAFEPTIKPKMSQEEKEKVIEEMKRRHNVEAVSGDVVSPPHHNKDDIEKTKEPSHAPQKQEAGRAEVTGDVVIHSHDHPEKIEKRLADRQHDADNSDLQGIKTIEDQKTIIIKGITCSWLRKIGITDPYIQSWTEECQEADSQENLDQVREEIYKAIELMMAKPGISLDENVTLVEESDKRMRLKVQAIDKQIKFNFINIDGGSEDVIPSSITISNLKEDYCTVHFTWKDKVSGFGRQKYNEQQENIHNVECSSKLFALLLMVDPKNGTEDKHPLLKIVGSQVPVQYRINYM